ncbi:hypothetical protein SPRG_09797 [Saprolegnia parasitica CBS 223.65]|uniref:Uncharacterized protein n=1 Tax=Saprolegnia parasitica (strain CBS 223.65) TaxID=695850 RepID=A0A067C1K1_SAPPC|nr:hypothetical protein SPRG_09797 [Saprolegnia parasitica CBS 223.65]KDO24408.1 hypothetical protein SPRG_09797 [Saprolegnia parasitica CBS 223.65]|eukprot:XP_012204838.1 hypothetical protein SPRG_09797 [Saprolegnia parasitica CBS 223.65]
MDAKAKYRERYTTLHATYEARLMSLGAKFEAALHELCADESLALLQQNPTSRDFVGDRLHELVAHALADEKEGFIKGLAEKLAKKDAALKESVSARAVAESQKKALLDELHKVVDQVEGLQTRYTTTLRDKDDLEGEVRHLRDENNALIEQVERLTSASTEWAREKHTFLAMQQDYVRMQALYAKDQSFYGQTESKLTETIQDLQAKLSMLEADKTNERRECSALALQLQEQTLAVAQAKEASASLAPRLQAASDEVQHLQKALATATAETATWRRKYESVGDQIELLLQEQVHEKELLVLSHEKEVGRVVAELHQARTNAEADANRWRKDFDSLEGRLTEREAALRAAMHEIQTLEAQIADLDVGRTETKVTLTKRIAQLEQEVAAVAREGQGALAAERKARESIQEQFASYKRMADVKLASLQTSLSHTQESAKRDAAAEKRLKWQEDAMKKHEQMLDGLKSKYEASMASLHSELTSARTRAMEETQRLHSKHEEASQLQRMRQDVARLAATSAHTTSKVAEAAKTLPGSYVPLAEHKAEIDKITAQLTLKFESAQAKVKEEWHRQQQQAIEAAIADLRHELAAAHDELRTAQLEKTEATNALVLERKHNVQWAGSLEDERQAKTLLLQRLDEAAVHLGRLKQLVHEYQDRERDLKTQLEASHQSMAVADASGHEQVAALTAELAALQDKYTRVKEVVQGATHTIQTLERANASLQAAAAERDANAASMLQEKAATIELLQVNLARLEAREQSTLSVLQQEQRAQMDRLQSQLAAEAAAQSSLRDELQSAQVAARASADAATSLSAQLSAAKSDLGDAQAKIAKLKTKYDDARATIQTLEDAQARWQSVQHEMALSQSDKQQQRQRLLEKAKLHVHTMRMDYLATKRALEHELDEERRYLTDSMTLLRKTLGDAQAQWRRHTALDVDRRVAALHADHAAALRALDVTHQATIAGQLEAQRAALDASWSAKCDALAVTTQEVRGALAEKETQLATLHAQLRDATRENDALQKQLAHEQQERANDRDAAAAAATTKDAAIEALDAKLETATRAMAAVQTQLQTSESKLEHACDALALLSTRVAPSISSSLPPDMCHMETLVFKHTLLAFGDRLERAIQERQSAAVEAAIKPFKDEREKAPLVLRRTTSSTEYGSDSVLGMAAPLATELASAKERIQALTQEMAHLREKYDAAKAKYASARTLIERLAQERDDAKGYAERLARDRQTLEHSLTTQLDEAFQQHSIDLDRLKVGHSRELDSVRHNHDARLQELEKEVDAQERKHQRLRSVLGQQESDFKTELEAMAKRYHGAKQKLQRVMEEMVSLKLKSSSSTGVESGERLRQSTHQRSSYEGLGASRSTRREATSTMHDLSLLMEQSLKASQSQFYARSASRPDA